MSQWSGKSPVEVDTALAENYYAAQRAKAARAAAAAQIRAHAGERGYRPKVRFATLAEAMTEARAVAERESPNRRGIESTFERYEAAGAELARLADEAEPMEAEYAARRWSRAFLVTNTGGHVHSSLSCSTCYVDRWDPVTGVWKPGTQYHWMVEYSGKDEAEIVEAAGSRACTVCYPSAPVDKPTVMFTPDEVEKAKAKEAREAAKVERERKRLEKALLPSGEPLVVGTSYSDRIATLSAARTWLTDSAQWRGWKNGERHPSYPAEAEATVAEAVAAKEGKSVEQVLAEAEKRAAKRR